MFTQIKNNFMLKSVRSKKWVKKWVKNWVKKWVKKYMTRNKKIPKLLKLRDLARYAKRRERFMN